MAGANYNIQRFSKLSEVASSPSESVQDGLSHILVKFAGSGNGNGVAVDHVESFLVNGMLALRFGNFFLTRVTKKHFVQSFVRNEARPDFVIVEPLLSLVAKVLGDIEIRMLGWLDNIGVNFKGKGSKIAIVDASSAGDVLFDVLAEGPDDEMELGLGVEGLN